MMNPFNRTLFMLVPLFTFSLNAHAFDQQQATDQAKAIVQQFGKSLKSELIGAMKAGGPENALNVCNIEAMPITENASALNDAQVSRVSLKNRNPDNVPNDWQREVLQDFDTRAASGEDIAKMASVSVVDHAGKKQLRFMKAVGTEAPCLACHGQQLSAEVQTRLDELYPDDKATGYSLGQVRGAIVVIKDYP